MLIDARTLRLTMLALRLPTQLAARSKLLLLRAFSSPTMITTFGLVSKWDDAHYGLALPDPVAAGALMWTPGLLSAVAERDVAAAAPARTREKYLADVYSKTSAFFDATEADGLPIIVNHVGTMKALRVLGDAGGKGL